MEQNYNLKIGYSATALCYTLWGFQPLYWNLCGWADTFFMMASRVVWASVFCLILLKIQGKLPEFVAAVKDRKLFLREAAASLFLMADWLIYLIAIRGGAVLETSLGYYIEPFVVFFFGALIYHEKIEKRHILVLAVILLGIAFSVTGFGRLPVITVSLALCFSVYAAIKKGLEIDSIVSTSIEICLCAPLAILYIIFFCRGEGGIASLNLPRLFLVLGAGVVTAVPMLFYSIGLKNLPMFTVGIMQYISPTLGIVCAVIMGESLTAGKILSFLLILIGVIIYLDTTFKAERKIQNEQQI